MYIRTIIYPCTLPHYIFSDVKPHNFVLTQSSRVQLIDFGSAAPLLPRRDDAVRLIPRRHCLVPCGTCDYISPEILEAHEAALVALELSDETDEDNLGSRPSGMSGYEDAGYGVETDWWSMGAMLYEMAYGVAPFFAKDIRQTYQKIVDFRTSLRFPATEHVSERLRDLLQQFVFLVGISNQRIHNPLNP